MGSAIYFQPDQRSRNRKPNRAAIGPNKPVEQKDRREINAGERPKPQHLFKSRSDRLGRSVRSLIELVGKLEADDVTALNDR